MKCLKCEGKTKVSDSRATDCGSTKRRRECLVCEHRFSTVEVLGRQSPSDLNRRDKFAFKVMPEVMRSLSSAHESPEKLAEITARITDSLIFELDKECGQKQSVKTYRVIEELINEH